MNKTRHAAQVLAPAANEMTAVDAALDYARYSADWRLAVVGENLWTAKFGRRTKGDDILGRKESETTPHACMRILAAEVIRLRALLKTKKVNDDCSL
jgi:hypothetical protein